MTSPERKEELNNGLTENENELLDHLLTKLDVVICGILPESQEKMLNALMIKRDNFLMDKGSKDGRKI